MHESHYTLEETKKQEYIVAGSPWMCYPLQLHMGQKPALYHQKDQTSMPK